MDTAGVLGGSMPEAHAGDVAPERPSDLAGLYDAYSGSLYRYFLTMLGTVDDAEDAMQELFCALARVNLRKIRDLRAYVFQAARRQAVTVLRGRRRHTREHSTEETSWAEPAAGRDDHLAEGVDLERALTRLPVEQRDVIVLHLREGFTFREIADLGRIPPNTVASRYRLALVKLRAMLQEGE